MKLLAWLFRRENVFPLIIGVCDGILTALTLAAGSVIVLTFRYASSWPCASPPLRVLLEYLCSLQQSTPSFVASSYMRNVN
jgi:hypothetical protein